MQFQQQKCMEHKFYVPLGPIYESDSIQTKNKQEQSKTKSDTKSDSGLTSDERKNAKQIIDNFVKENLEGSTVYAGEGRTSEYGNEETVIFEVLVPIQNNSDFRIEQLRLFILAVLNHFKKQRGKKPEKEILHTMKAVIKNTVISELDGEKDKEERGSED